MPTLPASMLALVLPFAPLFAGRVWHRALILLGGAILAPGRRTVAAALRVMGLEREPRFERYHRVLNRARWSGLAAGRVLLGLLVAAFVPGGPLLVGIDETLERRWGAKIAARGIYRDPVRSSHSHFVKASGLRWVCLMLLVPIRWAGRVWALPFLTALAPSERYDRGRGRRHKALTDWARQLLLVVRRWWPERALVAVADSTYAALEFLAACRSWANPVTVVTRLRLDAALYAPAPPREPGRRGRPRRKGGRLPTLSVVAADPATRWSPVSVAEWYGEGPRVVEIASDTAVWYHGGLPVVPLRWVLVRDPAGRFDTQALLCTDPDVAPEQILAWFVRRWQLEVSFEEVRRHLGVGTQRQWSDLAIARTTPALLGLFSLVTLFAQQRSARPTATIRQAAWYPKARPTFVDALALLRRELWAHQAFSRSGPAPDLIQVPRQFVAHLTDTLCYAA
jgi:DDE superfamily endonuclease